MDFQTFFTSELSGDWGDITYVSADSPLSLKSTSRMRDAIPIWQVCPVEPEDCWSWADLSYFSQNALTIALAHNLFLVFFLK